MSSKKQRRRWKRENPCWGEIHAVLRTVTDPDASLVLTHALFVAGVDTPEKVRVLADDQIDEIPCGPRGKTYIRLARFALNSAQTGAPKENR